MKEDGRADEGRRKNARQQNPEERIAHHLRAGPVARRDRPCVRRIGQRFALPGGQNGDERQRHKDQDRRSGKPGIAPAKRGGQGDEREREQRLARIVAERDKRDRASAIGREPAPGGGQRVLRHHALPEQAQHIDDDDQRGDMYGKRHAHSAKRQQRHDDHRHARGAVAVDDPPEPGQGQGAGERRKHVEPAELAVAEAIFGADVAR